MSHLVRICLSGLVFSTLLVVAFATGTMVRAMPMAHEPRPEAHHQGDGHPVEPCHETPDDPHLDSCSLCYLLASSNLPDLNPSLIAVERRLVSSVILPRIQRAKAHLRDPAIPPRGPPHA